MQIAETYSFSMASIFIESEYPHLLAEIEDIIRSIDVTPFRIKAPNKREISRAAKLGATHFYSTSQLKLSLMQQLRDKNWEMLPQLNILRGEWHSNRKLTAIKERLGLQIGFGKHPQLVYDAMARMPIFEQLGAIIAGIEICPMNDMAKLMSGSPDCFEDVAWDLSYCSDCHENNTPVLVIGVVPDNFSVQRPPYVITRGQFLRRENRSSSLEAIPIHIRPKHFFDKLDESEEEDD